MFEKDLQLSCEKLYKHLVNQYGGGDFEDVIFDLEDVTRACSILLHHSSDEFKRQEILNLFFTAMGLDE